MVLHPVTHLGIMHGSWNVTSERKLLLCIIGLQCKLKWAVIAQRMGEQFTEEACRYVSSQFLLEALPFTSFPLSKLP